MGDRSQILAMLFATKYRVRYVITGVIIGAFLNHGIAVGLGTYLSDVVPLGLLQVLSGALFVLFGIMGLRISGEDEDENIEDKKFGPIITVAGAYFISELGDKTQLMTITLSTQTAHPLILLAGTVSGMVLTGAIGIYVGSKLGSRIPELPLKILSSIVFIFIGSYKLFTTLPPAYTTFTYQVIYFSVLGIIAFIQLRYTLKRRLESTPYKSAAQKLYMYTHEIQQQVEDICLNCSHCLKDGCIIGYTKKMIALALNGEDFSNTDCNPVEIKDFDQEKVLKGLEMTLSYLRELGEEYSQEELLTRLRHAFETILINESIHYDGSFKAYIRTIEKYDQEIAKILKKNI